MNGETNHTENSSGLIRGLGLWAATAIVIGSMVGQSVFLVASDMSREVGSAGKVLAVWIIGGAVVLFGALCYAELGAAMPEAGGDYVYLRRGLSQVWGFLYGWTNAIVMRPASSAVIAAGLMRFVAFLLPSTANPLWTSSLPFPFRASPYQIVFTAAQVWAHDQGTNARTWQCRPIIARKPTGETSLLHSKRSSKDTMTVAEPASPATELRFH